MFSFGKHYPCNAHSCNQFSRFWSGRAKQWRYFTGTCKSSFVQYTSHDWRLSIIGWGILYIVKLIWRVWWCSCGLFTLIMMPSRWWSTWPWRSFQIRKRRRGKWIRFKLIDSNHQIFKYSVFSWLWHDFKMSDLHDQFQAARGRVERRLCWSESSSCENLQASVQGASCQTHQLIGKNYTVIIVSGSSIAFSDHCALITSRALLLASDSDDGNSEKNEQQKKTWLKKLRYIQKWSSSWTLRKLFFSKGGAIN